MAEASMPERVTSLAGAASGNGRFVELDALRGIAACSVMLFHFINQFGQLYGHSGPLGLDFTLGLHGVHLFFMISGFVIFMTLERTAHALDFVVSRFSRLYPAYWAALALTLVVIASVGLPDQHVSVRDAAINATMLIDIFDAHEVDGSYWTLQIEVLFYTQMLFWFMAGALGRIRLVILGWLALGLAYGIAARYETPLPYLLRELLIARFIAFFAAGILLHRVATRRDPLWQNMLLLGACALTVGVQWSLAHAMTLAVCAGVFSLAITQRLRFLTRQPFLFLGTVSYTLYLLHQDMGYIVIANLEAAGWPPLPSILTAVTVSLLLAAALSYAVERPAMRGIRGAYAAFKSRRVQTTLRRPV